MATSAPSRLAASSPYSWRAGPTFAAPNIPEDFRGPLTEFFDSQSDLEITQLKAQRTYRIVNRDQLPPIREKV